jgi:isopropylmalate/homocitrate/citramalate synthase
MDISTSRQRPRVLIHDPALRDGHHAVGHQLDTDQLRAYAEAAEAGHGNSLGASSLQVGQAKDLGASQTREQRTRNPSFVRMRPSASPFEAG